jgi:predicted YcjX-like family ATPase
LPLQEAVREPIVSGLRALTVPQDEESIPKFTFQENFDWEPFTEHCQVFKEVNGKLVKD